MTRPSWDTYFLELAGSVATRATCPRASIGCVIVKPTTHRILGTGYNGSPAGEAHCSDVGCLILADHCIRAVHAEVNAARQVTAGMRDLVAYVVGGRDVCSHCARELYAVGVRDVRWRESIVTLATLADDIRTWGALTFTGSNPHSTAEHLRREVYELIANPFNGEEQADVFHLLVQLARVTDVDLTAEVARKFAINRTRTWMPADNQGVVEHIREAVS